MKLNLNRDPSDNICTQGELAVDDVYECFTLEDVVREEKIYGETAIPAGTYRVIISYSYHFKRDLPLLAGVANYEGVRIHPGNTAANTEGCILVGQTKGLDFIGSSVLAFNALYAKLLAARDRHEDIWITIA